MNASKVKLFILRKILCFFRTNGIAVYILFCLSTILITYITNSFILTDSIYENYLGQQLSFEKISQIIYTLDKWKWLSYAFIPLYYLLKIFVISICLLVGLMLSDIKVSFDQTFKIVLISEIVFIFAIVLKTLYFLFINTNFTLEEFQAYYPLSLINYLDLSNLETWLKYPLQLVNLFEVAYILLIASGFSIVLRLNYRRSIFTIMLSYLSGLFIWIVFTIFLSVNFGA